MSLSIDMLKKVDLFKSLSNPVLEALLSKMSSLKVKKDVVIVKKGDLAISMFFIVSGRVKVVKDNEEIEEGAGSFFGELGLLFSVRRTATVIASEDCLLMVLSKGDFQSLAESYPELYNRIKEVGEQRFKEFKKNLLNLAPGKTDLQDISSYDDQIEYFRQVFMDINTDRSGEINFDQLKTLLEKLLNRKVSNDEVEHVFKVIDKDCDGKIIFEEFVLGLRYLSWLVNPDDNNPSSFNYSYLAIPAAIAVVGLSLFYFFKRSRK